MRAIISAILVLVWVSTAAADDKSDFAEAYKKYEELVAAERDKEAIPFAERALELGEKLYGVDSETTAILTYNLGVTLSRVPHRRKAAESLRLAVKRYGAVYGKNSSELLGPLVDLADTVGYFEFGEAVRHYKRAIEITEKLSGKSHPQVVRFLLNISNAEMRRLDGRAARSAIDRALRILEKAGEEDTAGYGFALFHYGKLKMGLKSKKDAEEYFLRALKLYEGRLPEDHHIVQTAHVFLVQLYEGMDRRDDATPYVQALSKIQPDADDNREVEPLFRAIPEYPFSAAVNEKEGSVDLQFTVDEKGFVQNVSVMKSKPGKMFVNSAIKCVNKWRYKPKVVNGKYVAREGVEVRITFTLED